MSSAWKGTERRIAAMLSVWWTGHPKAFIRSPCSGGWPQARAEGDMVPNMSDRDIPNEVKDSALKFTRAWSMDVKRRIRGSSEGPWTLEELLTARKHPILHWWGEMNELAASRKTMRFLVINKANRHSYVMFGEAEMAYLREHAPAVGSVRSIDVSCVPDLDEKLTVIELRSFLKTVDACALGGLGRDPSKSDTSKAAAQDSSES